MRWYRASVAQSHSDGFVYSQIGWGYFQNPGVPNISHTNYVSGVGFRLTITDPAGVDSYNIQYSDDSGQTWRTAKVNNVPVIVPVSRTGTTTWLDDGSSTSPGPLSVNNRWYRTVVAQSHQVFVGTPQDLSSGLTFAANGPAGKQLKVEVLDVSGKKVVFYINLTGSLQNYTISLPATGFDAAHVAMVNFVADKGHMGASGTVAIQTKRSYIHSRSERSIDADDRSVKRHARSDARYVE